MATRFFNLSTSIRRVALCFRSSSRSFVKISMCFRSFFSTFPIWSFIESIFAFMSSRRELSMGGVADGSTAPDFDWLSPLIPFGADFCTASLSFDAFGLSCQIRGEITINQFFSHEGLSQSNWYDLIQLATYLSKQLFRYFVSVLFCCYNLLWISTSNTHLYLALCKSRR